MGEQSLPQLKRLALCCAWLCAAAPFGARAQAPGVPPSAPSASAELRVAVDPLIHEGYAPVQVKLARALTPADGSIGVFVSAKSNPARRIDVTSHVQVFGDTVAIDFSVWPLNPEEHTLSFFRIGLDGKWVPIGQTQLTVRLPSPATASPTAAAPAATPAMAAPGAIKPPFAVRLDVGVNSQLSEKVGGSQRPSDRPHATDVSLQGAVDLNAEGDDWEAKAQIQLAGNSYRPSAPNFGRLGANAPKFDVPSYQAEAGWRGSRINFGQVSVDAHPLLASGLNNRGVAFVQRLPGGFDMGLSAQSGESLSGIRNFLGLEQRNSQFRVIGVGYDIRPDKPGFFRIDVNAIDARVPLRRFGGGPQAVDESRGAGARAAWRNDDSSIRLEGVFASSRFRPGEVPQNFPTENTGQARTFEAGYDAIRDKPFIKDLPLSLTFGARHEYSSPFYRSLGSGYSANFNMNVVGATARLGALNSQLQVTRRFDNVDEERIYIRNRVDGSAFSLNLPIGQFFGDNLKLAWAMSAHPSTPPPAQQTTAPADPNAAPAAQASPPPFAQPPRPSPWLPTLTFTQQFTHGYGDHGFVPAGYVIEDLPDVYVINRALGLQWQFERVTAGFRSNRTQQTNRQKTFENQSTWDKRYSAQIDWRVTDTFGLTFAYDPTYNYRFDTNVRSDARQVRGGLNWTINDTWQLNADLNHSSDFDSADTRYNRQNTSQVQLAHRFNLPIPGWKKLAGQASLRVSESRGFNFNAGSPVLEPTVTRIQLTVTLSLF